jgi:predicted RNA-binding Zn-ribbon protein involved in translation (DUF1610 family)
MQQCEICEEKTEDYSTCDSCEAIYCVKHIGSFNECPICGEEHTKKENF